MTEPLYLNNAYQNEAGGIIKQIGQTSDGHTFIIVDKTIFFAQGGGQPSDNGTITGQKGELYVKSVEYNKGEIKHIGKLKGLFQIGDKVTLKINWERRYQHMIWHSAGHLVDEAVAKTNFKLIPISGMHGIGGKMYIEYQGKINDPNSLIKEVNKQLADLQQNPKEIKTKFVTLEELQKLSDWVPENLPKNKKLRIIQIGDGRVIPDGGTQVRNTSELPNIAISKIEQDTDSFKVNYQVIKDDLPLIKATAKSVTSNTITSINKILSNFNLDLKRSIDLPNMEIVRAKYLGRRGFINQLFDSLDKTNKAASGRQINEVKSEITIALDQKAQEIQQLIGNVDFDVTLPGILPPIGHLHLVTQAIKEITDIFSKIGFIRRRYPEIDTDWYAAEGLNIPKDHPARDDQETFYVSENLVLTPHTSNGQLREMETVKTPPIKMINIGKTYRRQIDVSHTPMFHQFEGLLIDKDINITHLIGVGDYFVKNYFGQDRRVRLRPHHFQFTEPSFEIDITCGICAGSGTLKNDDKCRLCKSGWVELGGAGMVHPNVLKNGGINSKKYSGFAFGWGVERVLSMKYNLPDIRNIYTTDLRILNQF